MPGSHFMESSPFLLLFLLGYCLAIIEGELRCYCNESGCVATGYMCKSSAGKCFTSVEVRGETTHLTHGCLENLSLANKRSCRVGVDVISASKSDWTSGHLPLLLCCTDHMCNYREDIDVSIILTPKYNGTFHRGRAPANRDSAIYSRNHRSRRDEDRDLWFKAAVIAVPIAGGVILVLLVLLAVRMLRTDTRHHRRLIQIRQERSLTKAHVYISENFSHKTTKQHCSLFNEKTSTTCVPLHSGDTADRSSRSHITDKACPVTVLSDISNNYCRNSRHSQHTLKPDAVSVGGSSTSSTCHISRPCSSNFPVAPPLICSTNSDSYRQSNTQAKPCSFHLESPATNTNLPRDSSVRLHKDGHIVPHATTLVHSGTFAGPGHQHPFVSPWEKTCTNGSAV